MVLRPGHGSSDSSRRRSNGLLAGVLWACSSIYVKAASCSSCMEKECETGGRVISTARVALLPEQQRETAHHPHGATPALQVVVIVWFAQEWASVCAAQACRCAFTGFHVGWTEACNITFSVGGGVTIGGVLALWVFVYPLMLVVVNDCLKPRRREHASARSKGKVATAARHPRCFAMSNKVHLDAEVVQELQRHLEQH